MELKMQGLSKMDSLKIMKYHKTVYNNLITSAKIKNVDKPLTKWSVHGDYNELCILNPYSNITCFILYLYSCEFGDPPFYAELNRVTRTMDTSLLS